MPTASDLFFRDPDQDSRRAELRDFFGPNADVFLRTYDRMRTAALAPKGSGSFWTNLRVGGFEPAAFFCGPVWFFYRKMWAWAWGITAFEVIFGVIASLLHLRGGFAAGAILSVMAHRAYVDQAMASIAKLRGPSGALDPQAVRMAGGVSKTAGWISGTIYFLLIALTIVGLVLLILHPEAAGVGS